MRAVFLALAAAICAVGLLLFVNSARQPETTGKNDPQQRPPESSAQNDISRSSPSDSATDAGDMRVSVDSAIDAQAALWQSTVSMIVSQNEPPGIVAARLAAALPTFPPEGQLETARQIVELQTDEDYEVAEGLYFSPIAPTPVKKLIFEDMMNRSNSLKLPLLVRTVGQPGHPLRPEALDNLQLFVGRDVGDDPLQWQAAVDATQTKQRLEQEAAHAPRR